MNCGCNLDDDDMGEPKNVTLTTLAKAAVANDINGKDTLDNMKKALERITSEVLDKKIEELKNKKAV